MITNMSGIPASDLDYTENIDCAYCHEEIPVGKIRREIERREEFRQGTHTFPWAEGGWPPREGDPGPIHGRYVHDTPWGEDDEGEWRYFCSPKCEEYYMQDGDWSYFYCEGCDREVCRRHPRNGHMTQYRHIPYHHDDWPVTGEVCLRCYQNMILENGMPKSAFADGTIPGMFFSRGNPEPKEAGFEEVPGLTNVKVPTKISPEDLCDKAIELIGQGYDVICGYERLGIVGEGYVTLLRREN